MKSRDLEKAGAMPRRRGFSLVELMVALAVSGILLFGIVQIYAASSATSQTQQAMSNVSSAAQFVKHELSDAFRHAGFSSCMESGNPNFMEHAQQLGGFSYPPQAIDGVDDGTDGAFWPGNAPGDAQSNESAVRVHYVASGALPVDASTLNKGANFKLDSSAKGSLGAINQGDVFRVSDCQNVHVLRRTNVAKTLTITHAKKGSNSKGKSKAAFGNNPHTWQKIAQLKPGSGHIPTKSSNPHVSKDVAFTYFIANNPRQNPALYRRNALGVGASDQEIVENVEALGIEYGVTQTGNDNVDAYQTAAAVDASNAWEDVRAIRFTAVVRSEPVLAEQKTYNISVPSANDVQETDKRIRETVVTTVMLRNRVNE